ncbi:MAG TPA: ectonucleotide pyrophosphatase/phosphodiesterase [Pirellulales bacterium]
MLVARRLCVCLAVLSLVATAAIGAPRTDRCVILVSVDGLAHFYRQDPRADMPTLRRLAADGAQTNGMRCSFPTVTWPNHTTLVTGVVPAVHGVIGNNYLDRSTGKSVALIPDPLFDKDEIVKVPTIYDAAHDAGLKTVGIVWPASRNARSLDLTVPDMYGDGWTRFGTQSWLAELRAEGLPVDKQADWCKAPTGGVQRDWLYTRMARQAIQKHSPNLLLIHLVETDHVEHRAGPRSDDAYWAVSYADDRIRDLVEAVEHSPLRGKTTIFICSDHGFFPITKDIRPNVVLAQLGLLDKAKGGKRSAFVLSQGGAAAVYILDDAHRDQIAQQLRDQLGHLEGVEAVIEAKDFGQIGQPRRDEDPHGADLWLAAKRNYSFTDSTDGDNPVVPRAGTAGTHGYLPSHDDLLATCVMWGAGIKPGAKLDTVSNLDVAPTIAKLLGIELPTAQGKVMTDALAP